MMNVMCPVFLTHRLVLLCYLAGVIW